jgi:hypothetical protein
MLFAASVLLNFYVRFGPRLMVAWVSCALATVIYGSWAMKNEEAFFQESGVWLHANDVLHVALFPYPFAVWWAAAYAEDGPLGTFATTDDWYDAANDAENKDKEDATTKDKFKGLLLKKTLANNKGQINSKRGLLSDEDKERLKLLERDLTRDELYRCKEEVRATIYDGRLKFYGDPPRKNQRRKQSSQLQQQVASPEGGTLRLRLAENSDCRARARARATGRRQGAQREGAQREQWSEWSMESRG